jgi:hypothetical protein
MRTRSFTLWAIGLLLPVVMASSPPLTMAGTYYAYASVDTFVDVENGSNSSFSITPGNSQQTTGSAADSGYFSNSYTDGLLNSLPPPLFPGVYTTAQTTGGENPDVPGSSAMSSISNESKVLLFFTEPTLLALDVVTSTTTSVQPTSAYEYASTFADVDLYFDGSQIYSTSSTAGSFGTGLADSTTSGGASPLIYVDAHAGINELDIYPYAYGSISTKFTSPPPGVPEPSSLVLGIVGAALIRLCLGLGRRVQGHRLRS